MFDLDNVLQSILLDRINFQTGPTLGFGFRDRHQSTLDMTVWFQYQVRRNRIELAEHTSTFTSPGREEDLREVQAQLNPFLTIRFNYFFK